MDKWTFHQYLNAQSVLFIFVEQFISNLIKTQFIVALNQEVTSRCVSTCDLSNGCGQPMSAGFESFFNQSVDGSSFIVQVQISHFKLFIL